jgi:hypothetical protein
VFAASRVRDGLAAVPVILRPHAHDGACPCCLVMRVTPDGLPQSGKACITDCAWKSVVEADKTLLDELIDVLRGQHPLYRVDA